MEETRMKIYTKIAASLIATVFAIVAVPAQADHDTAGAELSADGLTIDVTCKTFGGLEYTLRDEVTFTNANDFSSLLVKLDQAHLKLHYEDLDPPKLCDAAQKLDDFSFKVKFLRDGRKANSKPKIFDEQGGEAIACLIEGSAAIADDLRTDPDPDLECTDVEDPPRGKGPKNK
jgi:hypothetical protein